MKLEELLKAQGLTDEQIKAITGAMSKEKIYTTNEENIEERYSKLKEQKTDLEGQLNTSNATISELKKGNKDNETLQNTIKDHETTIETLKKDSTAKIKNLTLDSAINNLLSTNKAKHSDLLASKFDREKLVIGEDGKVTGLEEQFKGIKESYKDLFGATISGVPPVNPEGGSGGGVTKEQFTKMGYKEKVTLYNTNKELYDQLSGQ